MQETLKDFFAPLKKRVIDPFWGTLSFSFIIFNWQIVVYLFSTIPAQEKVYIINDYIMKPIEVSNLIVHPLTGPLVWTIFLIVFAPIIHILLNRVYLFYQVIIHNDINKSEQKIASNEKIYKILRDENTVLDQSNKMLKDKQEELIRKILDLERNIAKTIIENNNLKFQVEQKKNDQSPTIKELIQILEKKDLVEDFMEISKLILTDKIWVNSNKARPYTDPLSFMVSMGILTRSKSEHSENEYWKLTDTGMAVKHNLDLKKSAN